MGAGDGYFGEGTDAPSLPTQVKIVRVLLFLTAGCTLLFIAGALAAFGFSAEIAGHLLWLSWPGVVGVIVALKIKKPSRVTFWPIIVVAAFLILDSLGLLGQGEPRGLTTMIIPVLILVFVLHPASRRYFHRDREEPAE